MEQWNPYCNIPNQNNFVYEEQNFSTPNYFGAPQLPYGSVPIQTMNYNNYFVPNQFYSQYGTNLPGTVYNVQELEAQQFASYGVKKNSTGVHTNNKSISGQENLSGESSTSILDQTINQSNLVPTAAEFQPSTSTEASINSQTFHRTENKISTGAIPKTNNIANTTNTSEFARKASTELNVVTENQKYTKSNNDKFNKNQNRNNFNRNVKHEEATNGDVNSKSSNYHSKGENRENNFNRNFRRYDNRNNSVGSERFPQNKYFYSKSDTRFNKNDSRDNNFNRNNYRDYSERNYERHPRDNRFYNNSNSSYRNGSRYDKTNENWRSGAGPSTTQHQQERKEEKSSSSERKANTEITSKSKSIDTKEKYKTIPVKDDVSQKDRLTEQVNKGILECLVCCERVRQADKIWHCQKCYHIFHFKCIMKWGNTSKDDNGWRCPACQHVYNEIPNTCYCYCSKEKDPRFMPGYTAHSCGEVCGRVGVKPDCIHTCNLLCHPGPCPKCEAMTSKKCRCGATSQIIQCSSDRVILCSGICNKKLNCGVHFCQRQCHADDCNDCDIIIHQACYCSKSSRDIPCSSEEHDKKSYSCYEICNKTLKCGNHTCQEICHDGECQPCVKAPDQVKTCPCGKSKIESERTSCLDPIPCCGKICGKRYPLCGTGSTPHVCKLECHDGECPSCPLTSFVRCRCGHMSCEVLCAKLNSRTDDARCNKKCVKKRSCGKHKCNQKCCIDIDHICPLPCNHTLSCGLHKCEQTCHKGHCRPCQRLSFEELFCECGASVIYPPIPCGTKRPHCTQPCSREHDCEHEALHTCHNQPECPPCTVLTTKWCFGGHEQRKAIPCHQKEFSCGLPCGKDLPCGRHKCKLPCHKGSCLKDGQTCTQPCAAVRGSCGHPCGLPCHDLLCPDSPCKEMVKVTCECGLRSSSRACVDMAGEYQRIATSMLASKMADMQLGHSIDIADLIGATPKKPTLRTLECNEDCRLAERNRRLAIGLQIKNPDLSAKLTPRYSDFMRQWAKKDATFCQMVHDKLTELVKLSKDSKHKSRSYSFPSMNREKRQFVHEYCEHFGCESAAYDQEPNRNVVATAVKEKAWLPSCSLLELIRRENGQRKVPGPILNRPLGTTNSANTATSLKLTSSKSTPGPSTSYANNAQQQAAKPSEPEIDYFNYTPPN